jgi:hypothetical protein
MKRRDGSSDPANSSSEIRCIGKGILVIALLAIVGCASPRPVTIRHESTPSLSDVAQPRQQQRTESAESKTAAAGTDTRSEQGTTAQQEPLKNKNVAGEEAAVITAQTTTGSAGELGNAGAAGMQHRNENSEQRTLALLTLLKSKNLISEEEAALITGQTTTGTAGEPGTAVGADMQRGNESSEQTLALVALLKSKNVISEEEAALLIGHTTTKVTGERGAAESAEPKKSVEEIKEEIRSEVTNELLRQVWTINNAMKEKDKRLRFGGDIRLRYENDRFDKNNFSNSPQVVQGTYTGFLDNTWADRSLFKYRVRFGAEAQVNNKVDAVIRLSTGNTTNPVSTNTTMNDYMNKDSVVFDLAYIKWQPTKSLTLYGGRMPNPWFSSDLVWDNDVNFEGFAVNVRKPFSDSLTSFLTVGAFPLQTTDPVNPTDFSQHGKWLYAGQVGLESKKQKEISAKVGVAYYFFKNITGVLNEDPAGQPGATNWSAPLFTQGGNTYFNLDNKFDAGSKIGLASKYQELNVIGTLDIGFWDPVHIIFLGDYVKNLGFKKSDVTERRGDPDPSEEVEGYQLGMTVGYPTIKDSGQWKVYFFRKYLEADAVVDAFTDSDFHLGGTNAKGWILGAEFGLAKNYWLTTKWLTADQISGPPLAIDVLQIDFNARF